MQTLRERLLGVLSHSRPCMSLQDFSHHPMIHEDDDEIQQELHALVEARLFECGVTTYPPKYGQTLYYQADNRDAENVFNEVRARG